MIVNMKKNTTSVEYDEESITAACEVLHVTQPTVSRQISDLEKAYFTAHEDLLPQEEEADLFLQSVQ